MDLAAQQVCTVRRLFVDNDSDAVRSEAITHGLDGLNVRSIAWRQFFGLLPGRLGPAWTDAVSKRRDRFVALRSKHYTDVLDARFTSDRPVFNDPLSLDPTVFSLPFFCSPFSFTHNQHQELLVPPLPAPRGPAPRPRRHHPAL